MNGAESLIRTLVGAGVEVCFANPGTSEMHLVQALDRVPAMRGVLCLFEGVCSGAADGYARMAGKPAATLLHLGPGLANAIANLHNARRAASPIINLIGNHPLAHLAHDAPLSSDIDTLARNFSCWIHSSATARTLAQAGADACVAARTPRAGSAGQIATLIVPADASWGEADGPVVLGSVPGPRRVADETVEACAKLLDAEAVIVLDGPALTVPAIAAANRIAAVTGCRVLVTAFPQRIEGGPGLPAVTRMPYFPEQILATLQGTRSIILAGASPPASFFAYPGVPGSMVPDGCRTQMLAGRDEDAEAALCALAEALRADKVEGATNPYQLPETPEGRLSVRSIAASLSRQLPDESIVCVDSGGGGAAFAPLQCAVRHTWLNLTGGSIGLAGPATVGAAIACPQRTVVALAGDGAAMYTNQAFWTQAREGLNVITVIFSNGRYGILDTEYRRLGVNEVGDGADRLFSLRAPSLDFTEIARGMGVPARAAASAEEFSAALGEALASGGPFVIDARLA